MGGDRRRRIFAIGEWSLHTQGWRAFTSRLTDSGVFTVSRWYNPGDVNESGRMIALALATMIDAGAADPRRHVFVARVGASPHSCCRRLPSRRRN